MEQFIHFVINHWLLWVALVIVITLLVYEETKGTVKGVQKISTQEAINLINRDNAVVVDLRTQEEFKQGHITAAINISQADLEQKQNIAKLNKYKQKPIILVCATGPASLAGGVILKTQGFISVYSLTGGITGWQRANLPLVK